jgi:hypothetical protein
VRRGCSWPTSTHRSRLAPVPEGQAWLTVRERRLLNCSDGRPPDSDRRRCSASRFGLRPTRALPHSERRAPLAWTQPGFFGRPETPNWPRSLGGRRLDAWPMEATQTGWRRLRHRLSLCAGSGRDDRVARPARRLHGLLPLDPGPPRQGRAWQPVSGKSPSAVPQTRPPPAETHQTWARIRGSLKQRAPSHGAIDLPQKQRA